MDDHLKIFIRSNIRFLAREIHANARSKGFWDEPRNFGECIALIHTELSEALEAARHGDPQSEHIPEYSGVEEELADAIVRILDLAIGYKYDIAGALLAKMEYNAGREYKHGKEF